MRNYFGYEDSNNGVLYEFDSIRNLFAGLYRGYRTQYFRAEDLKRPEIYRKLSGMNPKTKIQIVRYFSDLIF